MKQINLQLGKIVDDLERKSRRNHVRDRELRKIRLMLKHERKAAWTDQSFEQPHNYGEMYVIRKS